jgi:CRISPR-associated protein Cmr3
MTETVSISFSIVEPMLFRSSGEFDPFVRGTYSKATSLIMPSPSTVAGTLATYCISKLNKPMPTNGDWIEQYLSVLGKDVKIKGPILRLNNEFMVEDRVLEGFLNIESIKRKCQSEYNKLTQKFSSLDQFDEYLKKGERNKLCIKVKKDTRIGVALETRDAESPSFVKIVREGFFYSAELVDYVDCIKNEKVKNYLTEIIVELRGNLVQELPLMQLLPVRLGGEGRIAFLSFQGEEKISNEIKKKLWGNEEKYSGVLALYLATPAIFEGGKKIEEYVKEFVESMKYEFLGISGDSTVLGTGFSIKSRRRKPIYSSLKPGSIVFMKGDFNFAQMYLECALGKATQLGYGTIIPVPLT